jgi:hypothetical protein
MLVLLIEGPVEYAVEMVLCVLIHLPSFMETVRGTQGILRFCFRNRRGCNVHNY